MAITALGDVFVDFRDLGRGLSRMRIQWEPDADGICANPLIDISGALDRYVSREVGGSATYDVRLYDQYEGDILDATGEGLAVDSTAAAVILARRSGTRQRRVYTAGPLWFHATDVAAASGVFDLYWYPR